MLYQFISDCCTKGTKHMALRRAVGRGLLSIASAGCSCLILTIPSRSVSALAKLVVAGESPDTVCWAQHSPPFSFLYTHSFSVS